MIDCSLKEELEKKANELRLRKIRFTSAQFMQQWEDEIEQRKLIDKTTINYWSDRNLTSSYKSIMEDGRTYIIASYPYIPFKKRTASNEGYIDAHYMAYPKGRAAMQELANILADKGYKALVDPALPIKHIAYKSGIGLFGKNGLIHNAEEGSLMTLHLILTNASFPYSKLVDSKISDCGNCKKCINTCPNNAITDNGRVILSKCLRYYMLSSDIIPVDIREKMDNRILGCEGCQICCPRNASKYKSIDQSKIDNISFDIMEVLENQHGLKQYMDQLGKIIGKNYAKSRRIISMAVIAAGNSGDCRYTKQLSQTLFHQHPPIRAHSAWALGRLGGNYAIAVLNEALSRESNTLVISEIMNAINKLR